MKNEFIREKPAVRGFFGRVPFWHIVLPLGIMLLGFMFSSYIFASIITVSDPALGKPVFFYKDIPVYAPWMYPAWVLKFKYFHPIGKYDAAFAVADKYYGASAAAGLIAFFLVALLRGVYVRKNNLYGTARWATEKDLRKHALDARSGIVFGQHHNANIKVIVSSEGQSLKTVSKARPIQYNGNSSTMVIAPPRSGKGVSVIIPSLLRYPGSVIVLDLKGENYSITSGFRSTFSHVLKLSLTSDFSVKINPLMFIREKSAYRDANLIANILLAPTSDKTGDNETAAHFRENAIDLLTGCILHVLTSDYPDKTLGGVLDFISSSGILDVSEDASSAELAEAFHSSSYKFLLKMQKAAHSSDAVHQNIANISARNISRDVRERSGVFSTVYKALLLFEDPIVRKNTSSHEFDFSMFVDAERPISLYLTTPYADIERVSPVLRLIITMSIRFFSEGETSFGNINLKNRLLYLLDEFPALGRFPLIEQGLAVLPGYGITFMIICQSLNQITKTYGNEHSFFDQCKIICTFATGDSNTAKKFSDMIGMETVVKESVSNSGKKYAIGIEGINHSEQELGRQLINADEIMKLPLSEMIITGQGMPPYIAKKVVYYDDPRFRRLANIPGPQNNEELKAELPSWMGIGEWFQLPPWMFYDKYEKKSELHFDLGEKGDFSAHAQTKQISSDAVSGNIPDSIEPDMNEEDQVAEAETASSFNVEL